MYGYCRSLEKKINRALGAWTVIVAVIKRRLLGHRPLLSKMKREQNSSRSSYEKKYTALTTSNREQAMGKKSGDMEKN